MEKQPSEGLRITVVGENSMAREYATSLIADTLSMNQFTNVKVLNPAAVAVQHGTARSLFDVVKEHAAHIFHEPVEIQGSFASFEDKNIDGAFGPEPVGRFQWSNADKLWVQTPDDDPKGITLYVAEKDGERARELSGQKALGVMTEYPNTGKRTIEA